MTIINKKWMINALVIIAFGILAYSLALSYQQIQRQFKSNNWLWHTYTVIDQINKLRFSIIEIESRITIFVISGDKNIIKTVPVINEQVSQEMRELKQLTKDNPSQQAYLEKLEPLVNEKMQYMQKIIQTGIGDIGAALQLAKAERRLEVKENISNIINSMIDLEFKLLKERSLLYQNETQKSISELTYSLLIAGIIFLSGFILLNFYLKKREEDANQIRVSEQALAVLNNKLIGNEERYYLATEGGGLGLWDWKPGTDDVYYSTQFRKILGYTKEEFPDSLESFNKILYLEDSNRLWNEVRRHLETKSPYKIEYRLRVKSGQYKWFEAAGRALWDKNDKPVRMLGSIVDINDKKVSEERLKVQSDIIRLLASNYSFMDTFTKIIQVICRIFPCDACAFWKMQNNNKLKCDYFWPITRSQFGSFERSTKTMSSSAVKGIHAEVINSKKSTFFSHITDNQNFLRAKAAEENDLKSGCFIPVYFRGKVLGLLEFFTIKRIETVDQSLLDMFFYVGCLIGEYIDQHQSSQKLQESEIYKTAILDSAMESIITVDKNGVILSCNQQTTQMFHYPTNKLINDDIELLLPNFRKELNEITDKKITDWIGKYQNGEYFNAEVIISKMHLENQLSYVIIIRDISERKKIEKMKNEFISLVSHELRTPLTSILGSLDLILDGMAGNVDETANELLDIAKQNSERLVRLINDILDIEKIESGKMEFKLQTMDIYSIVDEAVTLNQSYAIRVGRRINYPFKTPHFYVSVDKDRLMQVLTNLMSNAIKFTPLGESVEVSVTEINNKVRVSVSDKGPGISEGFRDRIFQKFAQEDSTVSRTKGGTGLGLSISKSIIENLHGEIGYTTSSEGTTFYFDLPMVSPIVDHSMKIQKTDNNAKLNTNIMYVENDIDLALLTQRTLQHEGNIYHVKSLQTANETLMKYPFDLVILDLMLPDGNGAELITNVSKKNIPVIIYSAYELPQEYKSKVRQVLIKSKTSNKKILDAVRSVLELEKV